MRDPIKLDLNPVVKFTYSQNHNHDFNFALVVDGRILHTPFMCKDYLSDIFWAEITKRQEKVYGLEWKPGTLDVSAEKFQLAVMGGKEKMVERIEQLETFIHHFEAALGIPECSIMPTDNKKNIVVEFDRAWTRCGPLLSTLTTLIRIAGKYEGGDPAAYLDGVVNELNEARKSTTPVYISYRPEYMYVEAERLRVNLLPKLKHLLAGFQIDHAWERTKSVHDAHNYGILTFSGFPK